MPLINKSVLSKKLRLWHRRLGLTLLAWIFFVALSGFALNHSEDFGLDGIPLPRSLLSAIYGVEPPQVTSYYLHGVWLSQVSGDQLYWNRRHLGFCQGLQGVAGNSQELYAACGDSLYILSHEGEIIEKIGASLGLPTPIEAFGECAGNPCIASGDELYSLDNKTLRWHPDSGRDFSPSESEKTPQGLKAYLSQQNTPPDFHGERLVRDLHSGAFFGLGPWLMDIFALGLLLLSGIGFMQWWFARRPR